MSGLDVDPEVLAGSGRTLTGEGDAVAAAAGALDRALSASDAMAGHDAAGIAFGLSYTRDGQALLSAAEAAVNACRNIGFGVSMSATNYSRAEAASTTGGGEPPLPPPAKPAKFTGPTMPPPMGPGVAEPMLWGLVETFVGDYWPDGEPSELRGAASAWRTFGSALSASAGDLGPASAGIAGQDIPEGAAMTSAVNAISQNLTALAAQCNAAAGQLESFAGEVEATQNAIRDLLHRLSLSGIVEELGSIFTGHNPWDDIKEVAEDIKAVLGNMKRQAEGAEAIFQQGTSALDSTINSFEEWTRKEFVHYLGEDVGNAAATTVNGLVDLQYGAINSAVDAVHGIEQLDPTRFIFDSEGATKAWAGAADTAALAVPPLLAAKLAEDPDHVLDQAKGIFSYDDWNSDHPLRGLGHNIGDIAQLGIPGGAAAKPAVVAAEAEARAAGAAAGAETRAASGALRDAAGGAARTAGSDITAQGGKIADDLNAVKLPESAPPPSAGPGPSVTPDVKPPVDAPPPRGAEHAPPVPEPSKLEPAPAPHTPGSGELEAPAPPTPPSDGPPPITTGNHASGGLTSHEAPPPHSASVHDGSDAPPFVDSRTHHGDANQFAESAGSDGVPDPMPEGMGDEATVSNRPEFNIDDPLSQMTPDLRGLSEQHLMGTGETVLGPYRPEGGGPSYIEVAQQHGASYFDIGDAWNSATPTERLAANQHVLDMAIANRDTITFSVPITKIGPDTFTAAELRYLESHGYVRLNDTTLIPPSTGGS